MVSTSVVETNTTTTVDAPNINDEIEQNAESIHTQQYREADIPAAIETSDTVAPTFVTNSPQSRVINSASATAINHEIISSIERFVQNGLRPYEAMITKMARSVEHLENISKILTKKQRVNGPQARSLPTISTASDDQDRMVRSPNISRGVNINAGLKNDGNTCYLNAYLQVIASLPFLPICLSQPPTISSEKFPLYFSLASVISSMVGEDETKTIVDPTDFINEFLSACKNFNNAFEYFEQRKLQDSICINQHDERLLTLERSFNNC